jgi:hypothetical protein
MDSQSINNPLLRTVYQFRTNTLAGGSYRVENRTPFTLYVLNKSAANVEDCKTQAQITLLPMNSASLAYVNADYVSCVLDSDVAQISLPQDVVTFIRFTTFLQTEDATEQQTNSAIAIYNPASLEVNAIPLSEAVQSPPASTLVYVPSTGIDLFGWNGVYFTFDCDQTLQDSIYGFIQQSASSSFTNPTTLRYFAGNTGLLYIPRILRYLRVGCFTSPEWAGGNLETSIRRTVAEIVPLAQFRAQTFPFIKDYSILINESRGFYIPVLPPITRVTLYNTSASKVTITRKALTVDGALANDLDVWQLKAGRISTFYVETNVAFFMWLTNNALGAAWALRITANYDE